MVMANKDLSEYFLMILNQTEQVLTSCILNFVDQEVLDKASSLEMKKLNDLETQFMTIMCVNKLMTETLQNAYNNAETQI